MMSSTGRSSHLHRHLEVLVFVQEVFVEVDCLVVTPTEAPVDPLHQLPAGA